VGIVMSLLTFHPPERIPSTYEALATACEELIKQIDKIKTFADRLESVEDFRLYTRLCKVQDDNKQKLQWYNQSFQRLRSANPGHPLEAQIRTALDTCQKGIAAIDQRVQRMQGRQQAAEDRRLAAEAQAKRQQQLALQKSTVQIEAEQQRDLVDHLQRDANEVVQQMHEVNDLQHQLDGMIVQQHEQVVHVDQTIEDAKDDMVDGNAQLELAEKDQKSSSKCICCILGIVGLVVLVIVIVLVVYFVTKKKKDQK
jgi:cobalamin biosynthesis Mg chelatase CobN